MALVRLADLAKTLNLDTSTVSRALRDDPQVTLETRRRVGEEALRLGYRPHLAARALAEGRTRTLWFVIPDSSPLGPGEAALVESGVPFVYLDRQKTVADCAVVTTDNRASVRSLLDAIVSSAATEGKIIDLIVNAFVARGKNSVEAIRHAGVVEKAGELGIPVVSVAEPLPPSSAPCIVASGEGTVLNFLTDLPPPSEPVLVPFLRLQNFGREPIPRPELSARVSYNSRSPSQAKHPQ